MRKNLPSIALCGILAACSGGSSGTTPLPGGPAASSPTLQSVAVAFHIPGRSAATARGRRPLYISTNTGSAAISVDGAAPVVGSLSAGSANCSASSGGGRVCTMSVSALPGTHTFAVALYASSDGSGQALSKNTISQTIAAGTANTISVVLDGVVASIALALANSSPPQGTATTIALSVTLRDASGAAIVDSDPLSNAVSLTDSDTSGATTLSKTTLNSPADAGAVSVAYTGAAVTQAIFGATASGVAPGNVTPATLTPAHAGSNTFVDWATYGYDTERTGFNPNTTGITPSSLSSLHVAWQTGLGNRSETQPIIATNVGGHKALVVVAAFNKIQAFDALSGGAVWQRTVGQQNLQDCGSLGVGGTLQYDAGVGQGSFFVTGGNSNSSPNHVLLYRLDAATGAITGQTDITPNLVAGESVSAHSGITLANGRLYIGTASNCEGTATGLPSWRGRLLAVDPNSMNVVGTFFSTYGQSGQNVGGGGVWAWGGASADAAGNVYIGFGNAESNNTISQTPQPPFVPVTDEQTAYGDHLVKLSSDLSTVEDNNFPGFNFYIGISDLDYTGTPVIYQPPIGSGCDLLSATQGKGGELVINDTQHMTPALHTYNLSVPSGAAYYIGNPGYSPNTGYLYAAITSAGNGSSMLPPGLAAISGCGSTMSWNARFGPDSAAYGEANHPPRSAPTVTAGGVVFMGTPCTSDGAGGCGAAGTLNGALWAVDASSGRVLGNGKPVLITGDHIRMAPTADGLWLWVVDYSGNLTALTVDPSVPAVKAALGRRATATFRIRDK